MSQPNSIIKLLNGIPFTNTYEHSIFFESKTQQYNYFNSKVKHIFNNQSYQRHSRNSLRIQINEDAVTDCSYLMFTNSDGKWFYAFITKVEYINDNTTEITYQIDSLQTYFFDFTINQCYVEREHSATDNIGDNIVEENIEIGEYVYDKYEALDDTYTQKVVIIQFADTGGDVVYGSSYDGIYGGAGLFAFDYNSLEDNNEISAFLSDYIQRPGAILSIYMIPKPLVPFIPESHRLTYGASAAKKEIIKDAINGTESFGQKTGHVIFNKKLYTYPYNYFHLDNGNGSSLKLRYEFFENLTPVISVRGCVSPPVQLLARPCSYRGLPGYDELSGYRSLFTEGLTIDNFPVGSWASDYYSTWLAQNLVPMGLNIVGDLAHGKLTPKLGLPTQKTLDRFDRNLQDVATDMYSASIHADTFSGNMNTGNVNYANRNQQFYCARAHITGEYATIIDNYFSMYGYATRKVKVPNIFLNNGYNRRESYNYLKTNNCSLKSYTCPTEDARIICNIFDSGITFWEVGANYGYYQVVNNPLH